MLRFLIATLTITFSCTQVAVAEPPLDKFGIDVTEAQSGETSIGMVAKLVVEIRNTWHKPVDHVMFNCAFFDENGVAMDTAPGVTRNVPASGTVYESVQTRPPRRAASATCRITGVGE